MEVLKLSIQEALITMFTDDPINWLKWAVVFAVLIGGYAIAVPLYKKASHGMSWERKRDTAKSRDHVIKASLVDKHPSGEVSRYNWRAVYRYTIDGEEWQYVAHFKHPATPPLYLYLYYIDNPGKLFSCEEYHYENHKGLLLFPVIFLPWILAGLALIRNRKISRRIKRPPSQYPGIEMAVGIFIIILEFYIPAEHSQEGKILPKPHPSGSAQVRCSEAKPGSGRDPSRSPLRFQSDCRSQRWTGRRRGCWKRASSSGP